MKAKRLQYIVDLIQENESLTTDTLSTLLNVSKETIRRDLRELQTLGKIMRQHGRAKSINRETQDSGESFDTRAKSHSSSKLDIARQALEWVDEQMVIALDASSTCWHFAKQLPDIPLTVFTNSIRVCQELAKRSHITLISCGGTLERKYACYVNPSLLLQIKDLEIDLFLFSCEGVDSEGGLWESNIANAEFKTLLLKRSLQSILLIDKSKMGRKSELKIGHLDRVSTVIMNDVAERTAN